MLCPGYIKIREKLLVISSCKAYGGGGGAEEAEDWKRRETIETFEIMIGMNGEECDHMAKIVGTAGKTILASRL